MSLCDSWTKPSELPFILYGDTSEATRTAMALLSDHNVPYQLSLFHTSMHTPALETPVGIIRGIGCIQRFVVGTQSPAGPSSSGGKI